MGKYYKEVYDMLINYIVDSVDVVILVGVLNTRYLYNKLKETKLLVCQVSSFKEGYKLFSQLSLNEEKCSLLIENDVPDLYRIGII